MSPEQAHKLTQAIRDTVESHKPGGVQWWVDEFSLDCDAEEFWLVTEQALTAVPS